MTARIIGLLDLLNLLLLHEPVHVVHPGEETYAIVHLGQEWVHCVATHTTDRLNETFVQILLVLLDGLHGEVEELELRDQFSNLHLLVQLEVYILVPHQSIEQLIEVDVAFFALNIQLEDSLLELALLEVSEANRGRHRLHEVKDEAILEFEAAISRSELHPHFMYHSEVLVEARKWTILVQVQFLKLLDDNQDEQVQHHVGD